MDETVHIVIDGQTVQAFKRETILEAALRNGIEIPNLCYNKKISHTAACRLCIVSIEGRPGGIPSCTTPVEEGLRISVFTPALEKIRRTTLDLAMSNHNDDCISCVKDGSCHLQDLAFRYNLGKKDRRFPPIWQELDKTSDLSSQVLNYDASKCIQCNRCIKACSDIQGKGILTFVNRGIHTTVGTGYAQWNQSKCDGCGECAQICPVGAITPKQFYGPRKRIRAKDIDKTTRTTCPYCGVGCQLDIATCKTVQEGKPVDTVVQVTGAGAIPNNGMTCVKGRFGLDFATRPDRLKKPMIRKDGQLVEVEWPEAISYAAKRMQEIRDRSGADSLAGLSSARCTNEENFVFQKFIRSVIGTNNVDHCARLCHASTVAGLAISFGSGAMTNSIAELESAKVILVTGSNTTEAHPVIATFIRRAVQFGKAKLILVDPRHIDLARTATLWLRQKNGTDIAWLNGMVNVIIANGWENKEFISKNCENFEALKDAVKEFTPARVEELCGIPQKDLVEAARLFAQTDRGSIVYSMGITQHAHGTDNVKALANLAMVTGNIGRESTGVNPLRGQSNVQGACDMGALPNVYPGYQKVDDPAVRAKFSKAWGDAKLSEKPGLTVVEMMNAAHAGTIKGLYIMGENPMVSDPNTNHVREALEHLDFLMVQDIFLTETAQLADIVLPACLSLEKDGTFTNTERRVLPVSKVVLPPGQARDDWGIVQELARSMGHNWSYGGVREIMQEINALTPQYGGITPERIAAGERLQWPCPNSSHPGTKFLHKDGNFTRGKGLFCAVKYVPAKEPTDAEYPYTLNTGRNLFHYHTGSMTRRTKALPAFSAGPYIELSAADADELGVDTGHKVRVSSRRGTIELPVLVTRKVAQGSVFIPFHFAEAAANVLTIDALDPTAKIPEFKVCAVKIEKV